MLIKNNTYNICLSNKFANMGFICACLVVAYHTGICGEYLSPCWWIRKLLSEVMGCVAVPYFFLASGYFLAGHVREDGWWKNEIRKRIRSLLYPFIIWNMLYAIFMIIMWLLSDYVAGRSVGYSFPGSLWAWCGCLGFDPSKSPLLGPLWFVRSLLVFVVLSPVIKILIDKVGVCYILLGFVAYVCVYSFKLVDNPFINGVLHRALSLQGVCFFSVGVYLRMKDVHYKVNRCFCLSVLLVSVGLFLSLYVLGIARNQGDYAAFFIPFLMFGLWGIVPGAKQSSFISGMSFPIFLLHCFILEIFAYSSRFMTFLYPSLKYLIVFICSIVIPIIISHLIKRTKPKVYQLIMGGR